ncbi:MAG TPA: DUF4956 domain-containing protein [Gemmatimonadaceae bacterium]|jgi:hypothetical protein|nr:DUF4956 domain-containing protein [Gemmatimonadaceae bacterium]HRQ77465.1 DUF4956 domain-containing protein [Gemmatimonadaceae bacterium]
MNEIVEKIGRLLRDPSVEVDLVGFVFALLISALVAIYVSQLYQRFYEARATGAQIHRAFLLLGPSITTLFIAVQFSLPLSLGLLGALSIIRFRTPIKEPEEVGFIMLLISAAVVTATFQFTLLAVLLAIATLFLFVRSRSSVLGDGSRTDGMLLLVMPATVTAAQRAAALEVLRRRLVSSQLQGMAEAEGLVTLNISFRDATLESVDALSTELRAAAPVERLNVFFSRQGALP